jgi:dTDP-glucose 4,6-dehydratase
MKIIITGGLGFQGGHLAEAFVSRGHQVTLFNTCSDLLKPTIELLKDKTTIIFGSVTDPVAVAKAIRDHDVVFHLAASVNVDESLKNPRLFIDTNVLGTHHVIEAVREYGIRMIHASTCEVYGDGHQLAPGALLGESSELIPNSPYAASKAASDRWCIAYHKSFGVDVTVVRPFNIFGERQKSGTFGALIPIFVRKAMSGQPLLIFGDGSATRDYLHVSDLVRAYELVLDNPGTLSGKAINFASGVNTAVKDIAEHIAQAFGVPIEHGPPRPGEVQRFPADISLAKGLGFEPRVPIFEGIDRYIRWAKQQPKTGQ